MIDLVMPFYLEWKRNQSTLCLFNRMRSLIIYYIIYVILPPTSRDGIKRVAIEMLLIYIGTHLSISWELLLYACAGSTCVLLSDSIA